MRLSERVHLVGSGSFGLDLSDPFDCHVYLLDGGDELALVDVGAGMGAETIIENVRSCGFDPARIRHLLLTRTETTRAARQECGPSSKTRPSTSPPRSPGSFARATSAASASTSRSAWASIRPTTDWSPARSTSSSRRATRSRSATLRYGRSK